MTPLCQLKPNRVALIKPSALGDIVHSLPVLSALRRLYPDARITWVVNRAFEPLIRNHPDLSATLTFDRAAARRVTALCHFVRELRAARFDLAIDLQGLLRTGLMTLATGAKRRVGFANAREGATAFYTDRIAVPDADRIHAVDRYWRVVEALGGGGEKSFHVPLDPASVDIVNHKLRALPRPLVVAIVGARWRTKRWPPGHFAELIGRGLNGRGSVAFVGTRDDDADADAAAGGLTVPRLNLCGETSLAELAAVLAAADLVVGNDTGPLHLAAALGRPVVAPYTCTKVRLHGPYGQQSRAVEAAVPCQGSYVRTCGHMSCMKALSPDHLNDAFTEGLSAWRSGSC